MKDTLARNLCFPLPARSGSTFLQKQKYISRVCALLFFSAVLCPDPVWAQERRFQRFSTKDGLAHDSVYGLLQDQHGFMWFGTERGLSRFDSYQFLNYTHSPFDPNTLASNSVGKLLETEKGLIWIGTWGGGLHLFDPASEIFMNFSHDPSQPNSIQADRIQSLAFDLHDTLWIGTYNAGLAKYRPNTGDFETFRTNDSSSGSLPHNRVWAIQILDPDHLMLATGDGLAIFSLSDQKFQVFRHHSGHPAGLSCNQARDILKLREGNYLVGTDCGLMYFFPKTGVFKPYQLADQPPITHAVRTLYQDHSGTIWVGTVNHGLFELVPATGEMNHYVNHPRDLESLAHNSIEAIFEDHARVLWIATLGGLSKTDLKPKKFEQFQLRYEGKSNPVTINEIGTIYEDSQGALYTGTFGYGLLKLPQNAPSTANSRLATRIEQPAQSIVGILQHPNGDLWLCSMDAGLIRLNPQTGAYTQFLHQPNNPNSISHNRVRQSQLANNNVLWVASDKGVNRLDLTHQTWQNSLNNDSFKRWFGDNLIYCLRFDQNHRLWVGSANGLVILNESQSDLWAIPNTDENFHHLANCQVHSIHQDYRGHVWVGTNIGLFKISPDSGETTIFTQKEGLPSDTILSILEDQNAHLWLATDRGISRFSVKTHESRNFDTFDGLASNAFNRNAALTGRDGTLYFGGRQGLVSFFPNQVLDNPYIPPVALTSIKVFNQPLFQGGSALALENLTLNHEQKMLTFEFAALDFTNPQKNRFEYSLAGFDDQWIDAGHTPRANYTNLGPGKYVLHVRGSNNDGMWNEQGFQLPITITPPWWQSGWAIAGFLGLALLAFLGLPFVKIRFLQGQFQDLTSQVQEQTAALRERNKQLEEKNLELLTLDRIVATVNQKWQMDPLVQTFLSEGMKLFPNAQYGSFLKFDPEEDAFRFIAATDDRHKGLSEIRLSRETALKRYTQGREQLDEGVYLLSQFAELPQGHTLTHYKKPTVLMAMTVPQQDQIDAFLLYENYDRADAFRNSEMETLRRYRDHVISAITKVNLMTEISQKAQHLADTQQLLLENAHQAGMAEIATSILHNVGNALNSINTSTEMILNLHQDTPTELLQRISRLLQSHQEDLATFFHSHPQGKKLPDALQEIHETLKKTEESTKRELVSLKSHVDQLVNIIRTQKDYASMEGGLFETLISNCIEEALQIEQSLLEEKNIRVVKEYCELPSVKIQKSKFTRVMVHLINHAAQAMASQSSRILFIRTTAANGRVKIEVRDTGPGLTKDAIQTLFHQNFAVPKESGGLGLHYCATTAKELGGSLSVSSNGIGQGTVFTLVIPLIGGAKVSGS